MIRYLLGTIVVITVGVVGTMLTLFAADDHTYRMPKGRAE